MQATHTWRSVCVCVYCIVRCSVCCSTCCSVGCSVQCAHTWCSNSVKRSCCWRTVACACVKLVSFFSRSSFSRASAELLLHAASISARSAETVFSRFVLLLSASRRLAWLNLSCSRHAFASSHVLDALQRCSEKTRTGNSIVGEHAHVFL